MRYCGNQSHLTLALFGVDGFAHKSNKTKYADKSEVRRNIVTGCTTSRPWIWAILIENRMVSFLVTTTSVPRFFMDFGDNLLLVAMLSPSLHKVSNFHNPWSFSQSVECEKFHGEWGHNPWNFCNPWRSTDCNSPLPDEKSQSVRLKGRFSSGFVGERARSPTKIAPREA